MNTMARFVETRSQSALVLVRYCSDLCTGNKGEMSAAENGDIVAAVVWTLLSTLLFVSLSSRALDLLGHVLCCTEF